MILHGYYRSTAAWRVRIALNLKGLKAEHRFHHLRRGEHQAADYTRLNPQGLLPALELDEAGAVLTQSLAICEYLDETQPDPPLLPREPLARARVRAFAQAIACDIHPVQNLKVLNRLGALGLDGDARNGWARDVIADGLAACEILVASGNGAFCFGEGPGLADLCLVPQLYNAKRFGVDLSAMPRLQLVEAACAELPAFQAAAPERQADAE
ncbi:MAG: Maleylacetoacetate isomerase @ Glutathione S-transferase, zeta [uncultured Acetobacteraceae bacterium]|uniref:Maleylacetoacetate isomerase @ Glutathione S-transferase, zeta n=1 Tax=uncultured Acetobacteraceae bacterium TaxID=169975 RepID=A0A6J4JSG2_9PROT|nr:MAG: Maleylacetoacetate isomerase @ Glutathione S-transferase, zeta [uncultured Acetobacteraceae bacterium]